MTPASRRLSSSSSVISAFASARTSPDALSMMAVATIFPIRYSSGTSSAFTPDSSSIFTCRAVIRLPLGISTLPVLLRMSKNAISPRRRSGINSSFAPDFNSVMALVSKNVSRISSLFIPSARKRMVTGNFRRRSIRVKMQSFGSNSKSSQEPRYGMTRAENSNLPLECVLPRS